MCTRHDVRAHLCVNFHHLPLHLVRVDGMGTSRLHEHMGELALAVGLDAVEEALVHLTLPQPFNQVGGVKPLLAGGGAHRILHIPHVEVRSLALGCHMGPHPPEDVCCTHAFPIQLLASLHELGRNIAHGGAGEGLLQAGSQGVVVSVLGAGVGGEAVHCPALVAVLQRHAPLAASLAVMALQNLPPAAVPAACSPRLPDAVSCGALDNGEATRRPDHGPRVNGRLRRGHTVPRTCGCVGWPVGHPAFLVADAHLGNAARVAPLVTLACVAPKHAWGTARRQQLGAAMLAVTSAGRRVAPWATALGRGHSLPPPPRRCLLSCPGQACLCPRVLPPRRRTRPQGSRRQGLRPSVCRRRGRCASSCPQPADAGGQRAHARKHGRTPFTSRVHGASGGRCFVTSRKAPTGAPTSGLWVGGLQTGAGASQSAKNPASR